MSLPNNGDEACLQARAIQFSITIGLRSYKEIPILPLFMKIQKTLFLLLLFPFLCFAQREDPPSDSEMPEMLRSREGQQRPPMMGGGPGGGSSAIAVGDGYVFILSNGQLMKFDEKNLNLKGSISLNQRPSPSHEDFQDSERPKQDRFSENEERREESSSSDRSNRPPQRGSNEMRMSRMPMNSGSALTVANGSVYILSQGKLFKYDANTLELKESASLDLQSAEKKDTPKKSSSHNPE